MPFQSSSQLKACFAKESAGTAGSWDCRKWARETPDIKGLPERKIAANAYTAKPKKRKVRFGD